MVIDESRHVDQGGKGPDTVEYTYGLIVAGGRAVPGRLMQTEDRFDPSDLVEVYVDWEGRVPPGTAADVRGGTGWWWGMAGAGLAATVLCCLLGSRFRSPPKTDHRVVP